MALTWEKWRELFKGKWADVFEDAGVETGGEVTAENFKGILPIEKGGMGADNFNQGRGNLMDITSQITSENLNDVNFYRQFKGRTVAILSNTVTQNGAIGPTSWGTLTTEVAGSGNNYTQAWQDVGGTRFIRSANGTGWSNDPSGKDAWLMVMTGDIRIPRNTDLNNLQTSGFYYCPGSADAATMSNLPVAGNAFALMVIKNVGCTQICYNYASWNTGVLFHMRSHTGSTWSSWVRFSGTAV